MKIVNLIENTTGEAGCACEHGLCFYIETKQHKILMDTGQTDLVLENAQRLGIDLTQVDSVFLSHGHYDHSGGILPFAKVNDTAKIYVTKESFGDYYSTSGGSAPRAIGIDPAIRELKNLNLVEGTLKLDEELELFSGVGHEIASPLTNNCLWKKVDGNLVPDDFSHEQCLVIRQEGRTYLFSGCAHHGILNIMARYKELYGGEPDYVFSGFHMMRKDGYSDEDIAFIKHTANELTDSRAKFFTGHCTGTEPYEIMKDILKEQIEYVHCGDSMEI
ncbi:MAG: MBL fold metallo-hydrolase [Eubacterium sp.]|nr:MBL fold metallo-hydrolase [Eubacterium sp.]